MARSPHALQRAGGLTCGAEHPRNSEARHKKETDGDHAELNMKEIGVARQNNATTSPLLQTAKPQSHFSDGKIVKKP